MAETRTTAQEEIQRAADALGWSAEPQDDIYFGKGERFTREGRIIEVYYTIDGGVKIAMVRENGHNANLIATNKRRERVIWALRGVDYELGEAKA